ncbi:transcriptional regulator, LysR family [Tistlia consotensis]|uniref:Transcriptional regulator, LysR family n=1 Tax=Tistlia consotensis USBA 355 TaxID=560819 RepID=A0A1Y6CRZ1_9PROT|nr:LysR family transcriptional regulator [Tistlia consotensis]SMF71832.1 transcriptional regulator, LysR family [Tistlia consotensis USBA 355]SNS06159.1 transcriptional regulator, LysR family [Tistlia consotensis]
MKRAEPSWDLYRTFVAVLRAGSLSAAARALDLTQPTVTRHVAALERTVGCELFLRSRSGLSPTAAALELRPYAETLAATAAALLRAASADPGAVSGRVRISASEVVGAEVLPPILAGLRERHPGLVVELALSNAVENLLRRDADVAVRMVEPSQQALVARRLGTVALGLFARRDYLERHGVPERIEDLAGHSLIGFDRETPAIRALLRLVPGFEGYDFALRSDSDLAQLAAIRAGFGIGACQVPLGRRGPDLVRLLPEAFAPGLGVWLVMHEDLRGTPRCRAVFDGLAEGLAGYLACG